MYRPILASTATGSLVALSVVLANVIAGPDISTPEAIASGILAPPIGAALPCIVGRGTNQLSNAEIAEVVFLSYYSLLPTSAAYFGSTGPSLANILTLMSIGGVSGAAPSALFRFRFTRYVVIGAPVIIILPFLITR